MGPAALGFLGALLSRVDQRPPRGGRLVGVEAFPCHSLGGRVAREAGRSGRHAARPPTAS